MLDSSYGAAQVNFHATNSGTFTVVADDYSTGFIGSGAYTLTVNGLTGGLKFRDPTVTGSTTHLTGVGGVPGRTLLF